MDSFWPAGSDFLLHLSLWWKSGWGGEVGWERQIEKGQKNKSEWLTRSQSTFRKNGWPMMSAKPVWGWQPRRSLGSCGVKRWEKGEKLWGNGAGRDKTKCQRAAGEVERATKQTIGRKHVMAVKVCERTVIVRLCGQVRRHEGGCKMKTSDRWQPRPTTAVIKWFSRARGRRQFFCLTRAHLTPAYLVEESLEDAGSLDWQRAGNSDLFFQYYCRGQGEMKTVRKEQILE